MFSQDSLESELSLIEERLITLRRQALKNGQCLLLNEKESELFVGDVIRRHPINKTMIMRFLSDAKVLRKYKDQSPRSLLDLVTMLGGFNKALRELREATLFSQTWGYESYKDYLMHLSDILQLCRTHSFNRTTKKLNPTLECSLCWRAIKPGSAQYCAAHQEDKMLRQRDERRLFSAIIARNDEHSAELKRRLASQTGRKNIRFRKHYWSSFFAEDLTLFQLIKNTQISTSSGREWRDDVQLFLDYLKQKYTYWNEYIRRVSPQDSKDWVSWLGKVRKRLDPDCPPIFSEDDIKSIGKYPVNIWLCPRGEIEDWALLLRIVHRFESYHALHSTPKKRGPQIGAVPKNDLLREKIKKIANKQIITHGKIKAVVIADELSISPQRVSILLKELGLR